MFWNYPEITLYDCLHLSHIKHYHTSYLARQTSGRLLPQILSILAFNENLFLVTHSVVRMSLLSSQVMLLNCCLLSLFFLLQCTKFVVTSAHYPDLAPHSQYIEFCPFQAHLAHVIFITMGFIIISEPNELL